MAVLGPLLAANSERIGRLVLRPARVREACADVERAAAEAAAERRAERDRRFAEEIALVEAAGRDERENGAPETTTEAEPETVSTGTSSVEYPCRGAVLNARSEATRSGVLMTDGLPKGPTMFEVARQPKWIIALVVALAVAGGFAALGQWQLERSIESGVVFGGRIRDSGAARHGSDDGRTAHD